MLTILFCLLVAWFIFVLAGNLVVCRDFKYYRKVYQTLPDKTFYRDRENYIYSEKGSLRDPDPQDLIIYFPDGDFLIWEGVYLWSGYERFLLPYTWYWNRKYKKWFRENIDINKLESHF